MVRNVSAAGSVGARWSASTSFTPTSAPRGVERAEVFVAFTPTGTPPPNDFNAFRYVQSMSDGSTVLLYESPQGGLQAHYLARWVTRRNAYGPWSEAASATVAA